jgi:glutathione synthase/RimK-type ligase-like ATP-grasp enzyme
LREFIAPIYELLELNYGGLDIIEDAAGALRLVEINSRPGFSYFVRDNGREPLVKMYEMILTSLGP